ncbi:MAG: GNAT family N-acetyltransferase [Saprospiraceae bacterium]|nr:GNAT family N-acetyltransferase [Saprospiraceae bacterium]
MSYQIRLLNMDDIPSVAILFDQYRIFYNKETNVSDAIIFLTDRFINNESVVFVAVDSNDIITGFTQLYPLFSSTRMKRLWLLNDLFVHPKYRSKGISKLLIDAAKNWCYKTKACGLMLETSKSNEIGNKLYPATAFELDEDHNYYYWDVI